MRQDYAKTLRSKMDKAGVTINELAERSGVSRHSIRAYLSGRYEKPSYPTSVKLAEVLGEALLVNTPIQRCALKECGAEFKQAPIRGRLRRYCSRRCMQLAWERRRHGYMPSEPARLALTRLPLYQEAIARHCNWCEPDGVCKTSDCALQEAGVSLLPLAMRATA